MKKIINKHNLSNKFKTPKSKKSNLLFLIILCFFIYAAISPKKVWSSKQITKDSTNKFNVPCLGYKYIIYERKRKEDIYYRTNEFTYAGREGNCLVFKSFDTSVITLVISQTRIDIDSCQ